MKIKLSAMFLAVLLTVSILPVSYTEAVWTNVESRTKEHQKNIDFLDQFIQYPACKKYLTQNNFNLLQIEKIEQMSKVINQAKELAKDKVTDTEKAYAIHTWIAENVWYHDEQANRLTPNISVPGIFESRATICDGYTRLEIAMFNAVGIPAVRIAGDIIAGPHAYTLAYMDGKWLYCDSTLDSPNVLKDGVRSEQMPSRGQYFGLTAAQIAQDHLTTSSEYGIFFTKADLKNRDLRTISIEPGYTEISAEALSGNAKIEKVIYPETFAKTGEGDLENCKNLKEVVLPDNMSKIGCSTFSNCVNLIKINMPKKLKVISPGAFSSCYKLKSVVLPEGMTTIEADAFAGCDSLEKIVIPSTVKYIAGSAFSEISGGTISGFKYTSFSHKPKNLVIYAKKNSYAHQFAVKYKIKFKEI